MTTTMIPGGATTPAAPGARENNERQCGRAEAETGACGRAGEHAEEAERGERERVRARAGQRVIQSQTTIQSDSRQVLC